MSQPYYKVQKEKIIKLTSSCIRQQTKKTLRTSLIDLQLKFKSISKVVILIKQNLKIEQQSLPQQNIQFNNDRVFELFHNFFWKSILDKLQLIIDNEQNTQFQLKKNIENNYLDSFLQNLVDLILILLQTDLISEFQLKKMKIVHKSILTILQFFDQKNIKCIWLWQRLLKFNGNKQFMSKYIHFFLQNTCLTSSIYFDQLIQCHGPNLLLCSQYIASFYIQQLTPNQSLKIFCLLNQLNDKLTQQKLNAKIFENYTNLMSFFVKKYKNQIKKLFSTQIFYIYIKIGNVIEHFLLLSQSSLSKYLKTINFLFVQFQEFSEILIKSLNKQQKFEIIFNLNKCLKFIRNITKVQIIQIKITIQQVSLVHQIAGLLGNIFSSEFQIVKIVDYLDLAQNICQFISQEQIKMDSIYSVFMLNFIIKVDFQTILRLKFDELFILTENICNSYQIQVVHNGYLIFLQILIKIFHASNSNRLETISYFLKIKASLEYQKIILTINNFNEKNILTQQIVKTCYDILQMEDLLKNQLNLENF